MTNQNSELDDLSADELRGLLIALQEENKVLTDLFHAIVFDLRMPLSMIAGAAHLLLDEEQDQFPPLDENQAEVAEIARFHATRANEVIRELLDRVKKAKSFENFGVSLVRDYRRQLFDANQKLDNLSLKYEATQDALQNLRHELLEAVNRIMGFSEIIQQSAEYNHEVIKYYFFDRLKAIELIDAEPVPETVTLAEIGEMTQFLIESELALDTAVSINKREAEAVIKLLDSAWDRNRKSIGSVLKVIAETDEQLRFVLPNATRIHSYHVKEYLDNETGRLYFSERERYLDPVGLATALVEKYGGAVYAELIDDSTCILSFTLPVYQEGN